jgi:hypothetical protein
LHYNATKPLFARKIAQSLPVPEKLSAIAQYRRNLWRIIWTVLCMRQTQMQAFRPQKLKGRSA